MASAIFLGSWLDFLFFPEEQYEVKQDDRGDDSGYVPDLLPLVEVAHFIVVGGESGDPRSNEHACTIRSERE